MQGERWYFEIGPDAYEIDWETQGDPLVEYIRNALSVNITLTSWIAPTEDPPTDPMLSNGYCLYSESLSSRLVFAFFVDGIHIMIEVDHEISSESDLEPWKSAFTEAHRRLSENEPEYHWWAAIGQRHGPVSEVLKLVTGGMVGDVAIEAAGEPYTEAVDDPVNPRLGGASMFTSFPLVVRGKSRGYNWHVAARRAVVEINSVCALLSLAFDSYWSLRISPDPDEGRDVQLPSWGYCLSNGAGRHHLLGAVREVELPAWISPAWIKIGSDAVLSASVHAHAQGLALMREHPSLSLVCFVSAIESVGAKHVELKKCEHCNSRTGAQRRFRKALKTVYSNKETDRLATSYEFRSQTAHAGALHGDETSMGSVGLPIEVFAGRPQGMNFRYQTLWDMQKACKQVLVKHLS